jgi:hypothetical protein
MMPRTQLTEYAEQMLRHPRVLNYWTPQPPIQRLREAIELLRGRRDLLIALTVAVLLYGLILGSPVCGCIFQALSVAATFWIQYKYPSTWW